MDSSAVSPPQDSTDGDGDGSKEEQAANPNEMKGTMVCTKQCWVGRGHCGESDQLGRDTRCGMVFKVNAFQANRGMRCVQERRRPAY